MRKLTYEQIERLSQAFDIVQDVYQDISEDGTDSKIVKRVDTILSKLEILMNDYKEE